MLLIDSCKAVWDKQSPGNFAEVKTLAYFTWKVRETSKNPYKPNKKCSLLNDDKQCHNDQKKLFSNF